MEKRRGSQSTPGSDEADDRARKRRKQSGTPSNYQQNGSSTALHDARALYDLVWNRQERNRTVRTNFEQLPGRQELPDYYEKIPSPISLREIKDNLDHNKYQNVDELKADLLLMCQNATTYNKAKSQIHNDALRLRNIVEAFGVEESNGRIKREASQATPARGSQRPSRGGQAALQSAQLKIIEDMWNFKDANGYWTAENFVTLPNKKTYADYYRLIKQPISLTSLKKNVKEGRYPHWHDFEQACLLIRKNAEEYNDEESLIVRDARALVDYCLTRIATEKSKHGDVGHGGSGIKLRLNVGGQRAPSPANAPTPAPTPKIKLNFGGRQTPAQVQRQASIPSPAPPPPLPPPAISPQLSASPVANGSPNIAGSDDQIPQIPVQPNHNHIDTYAATTASTEDASTMAAPSTVDPNHLQTVIAGSPASPAGVNGHSPVADSIVVSTRSQTPQPQFQHITPPPPPAPVTNSMPPPRQMSATPSATTPRPPSYSPVPFLSVPHAQPHTAPPTRPSAMVIEEPFYRAEGKDAKSALFTSLRISSTSSLKQDVQYTKILMPDNDKVTIQYSLNLPSEHNMIAVTPVLSQTLLNRPHRLTVECRVGNSVPKQLQSSAQQGSKEEPIYEILLGAGVVNIVECTAITASQTGQRGASGARVPGWEFERFRLYITLVD